MAVVLIIVVVTFATALRSDKDKVWWLCFIGAFDYFAIRIGVVWEPGKIVGLALLILVLTHWGRYSGPLRSSGLKMFSLYFSYAVAMTLFQAQSWPYSEHLPDAFLYNEGRYLVQFSRIIMGLATALVVWRACYCEGNIRFIVRAAVAGSLVLAGYGLYQVFASQYGLPTTGITRGGGIAVSSYVHSSIGGNYVQRAYSFAGEPKGLAAILSLGMLLLAVLPHKYIFPKLGVWIGAPALVLISVVFAMTYSSAGYIMLIVGFTMVGVLLLLYGFKGTSLRALGALPLIVAMTSIILGAAIEVDFEEVIGARITDRVTSESALTYADRSIVQTWRDRPDLLALGAGLGGSSFYVRQYSDEYAGFAAAPRGILGRVGDVGLLGIGIWALTVYLLFSRAMRYRHVAAEPDSVAVLVVCSYCVLMVLTVSTWFVEWLLYGVLTGVASVTRPVTPPKVSATTHAYHPSSTI